MNDTRPTIASTLVFAGSVLLILGNAPAWCVSVALATVAWRLWITTRRLPTPRPRKGVGFLIGAVTAALVVGVALSFRTLNGLGAGTALLVVMGALKLIESRTRRDDAIVIGVSLFLLLSAALATQALWRVPLYLLLLWGACVAIAMIAHSSAALTVRGAMRLSARALAMSIPLALACFLFFPRFAGQFWALQRGEQATTGLSDQMSPGSISKLANEYDPAFRVRFATTPPAQSALYWRGPVLNSFDGFTWRRDPPYGYLAPSLTMVGAPVRYRVTLEPSNRVWMFALDTIAAAPRRDFFLSADRQLTSVDPITSVTAYDAVSYLTTRNGQPLSAAGRGFETRLAAAPNPRTRALALEIRARSGSDRDYARAVLDWFQADGLEYTLEPGTTSIDSVDTTLFDSKKGFCGHFASAYAMMMRAAGVPARVVTGYLGGEWNPAGGYLIVRQSDAHAWTEVWLDDAGWTRIDPTAVVAPERLQRGIFDLFGDSLPGVSSYLRNSWFGRVSLLWDGANQWWQDRVLEFDMRSQLDLLRKLGIDSPEWEQLGWAFAAGLLLWIAWISLSLRRSVPRARVDRVGRAWVRATRKLAKAASASPRAPSEGPLDFARRVAALRPDLKRDVEELATRYARLRFGPAANHDEIAAFERDVRRMRSGPRL
jgi:transglutaminase-like putative cysteine protease